MVVHAVIRKHCAGAIALELDAAVGIPNKVAINGCFQGLGRDDPVEVCVSRRVARYDIAADGISPCARWALVNEIPN